MKKVRLIAFLVFLVHIRIYRVQNNALIVKKTLSHKIHLDIPVMHVHMVERQYQVQLLAAHVELDELIH